MNTPPLKPAEDNHSGGYKNWSRRKKILAWAGGGLRGPGHHRAHLQRGEPGQASVGQPREPERTCQASTDQDHRTSQASRGRQAYRRFKLGPDYCPGDSGTCHA